MLVKSANDMAVVLAEGVGGRQFFGCHEPDRAEARHDADELRQSDGLPADARSLRHAISRSWHAPSSRLPEYEYFVHIPSIRFGRRITQNFNKLMGRHPGATDQDQLHLHRLQSGCLRHARRQAADRRRAGASSATCARCAPRSSSTAASPITGWRGSGLRSAPSIIWADRRLAAEPRDEMRRKTQASRHRRGRRDHCQQFRGQRERCELFAAGLQQPMPAVGG